MVIYGHFCMTTTIPKHLRTHLRSAMRKLWMMNDTSRQQVINESRLNPNRYLCSKCGEVVVKIEINHLSTLGSFSTWQEFIRFCELLFCSASELEAICHSCHLTITKEQRAAAKRMNNDI